MSNVHNRRQAIKSRARPGAADRSFQSAHKRIDSREQLVNACAVGPFEAASLPLEMITSLHGIILDFDQGLFREARVPTEARSDPACFYESVIRPMLARSPVFNRAEVRSSGSGLHALVRFEKPLVFDSDADRQRW